MHENNVHETYHHLTLAANKGRRDAQFLLPNSIYFLAEKGKIKDPHRLIAPANSSA